MRIIITLKNDEIIEIRTSGLNTENISTVLSNNSNHLFFNRGFDKKIIIMKESIKTIEFVEINEKEE